MRTSFLSVLFVAALGCGGGGGAGGDFEFSFEQPFLPDYEIDTGLVPEGQKAQVRVVARAGGSVGATIAADAAGDEMVAVAGSLRSSADFTLEVYAKVDLPGAKFDDLVQSFGYTLPESLINFESFAMDVPTVLDISLPPEELATIPLGSVPGGSLRIAVESGDVQVGLQGQCAQIKDELAQFVARAKISGNIELSATIVVDLPIGGTKEFGPFAVNVELPDLDREVDMGTFNRDGSPSDAVGPCTAGGGKGDGTGGPGGSNDPDANCGLPSTLDLSTFQTYAQWSVGVDGTPGYTMRGQLGVDQILDLSLFERGVFGGGIAPGVYEVDRDMLNCSTCASIATIKDGELDHFLIADSGTLVVSAAGANGSGPYYMSFSDLKFVEVDQEYPELLVNGGCRTSFGSDVYTKTLDELPDPR